MKHSDNEHIFSNYKTPYGDPNNGMECLYDQYKADTEKIIINNGKKYYKIIESFVITVPGKNPTLVATVDIKIPIRINDAVVDNYGNKFIYSGNAHISFRGVVPGWYMNTAVWCLSGGTDIGEYVSII